MRHNRRMTFPLGSLRGEHLPTPASQRGAAAADTPRWRQQALLLGGGLVWLLMLLALVTHQARDPGFSTSGSGMAVANKAGLMGAWVSDLSLFLFGYSVWWLMLVGLRVWLATLAQSLRGVGPADERSSPAWMFWLGLALLMAAS